ncbi:hypothetical protein HO173_006613 [Letharia columbiana]|uniref:Major facilitator superfamily (MFS) profile domain-containing protein n=1 Tax=Letharia columbiana TaxID=112416 RepID=A0A8H6FV85_9LECA|nr:uncharacterized protein HO173_006613 [Letharia columbiana]KAF6235417.1 hypothetical protein HO173_006613 [Letharia columbiana]
MDNSVVIHDGDFELEDASSSWRQKLPRIASDPSLCSTAISEEDASEHAKDNGKESFKSFTADEERVIVRKLDRHLVLFIAFLYMLSFLDRSNIGNARIAGLTEDLNLDSSQYEWLLTSFYCTYITFQWMTLLYGIVPAHIYISLATLTWSLTACLQAVASSFSSMLVLRALLGIGEAAFSPGIPFLLSFFFKREELAFRTGLFISAAPLATSFASSLAWLITKVAYHVHISAWRVLFLVEGFPSIIVAILAWYQIPDTPDTARFLNQREKKIARLRLSKERHTGKGTMSKKSKLDWQEIREALTDVKCWITACMFFSCNVAFSSLPPFLPTIVHEMHYSALASQALSAPPYFVAFLVVLVTAFLSDRSQNRSYYVIFHALLGGFGYLSIAIGGMLRADSRWRYAGVYPAAAGFFSAITLILTWTINNQNSDSKRGTGVVMLNLLGQFGPLVGTRLYPDSDKPYYVKGMAVCSLFMFLVALLAWWLRRLLTRENENWTEHEEAIGEGEDEALVDENGLRTKARFIYIV